MSQPAQPTDAPVELTLDEVKACMSERGLLELDAATERETNRKLTALNAEMRREIARLINSGGQLPDDPAADQPAVEAP